MNVKKTKHLCRVKRHYYYNGVCRQTHGEEVMGSLWGVQMGANQFAKSETTANEPHIV